MHLLISREGGENRKHLLSIAVVAAASLCNLVHARAGDLPPIVSDIASQSPSFGAIFNLQIIATNNPEIWSVPVGPTYVPGFGALPDSLGMLIPPSWDAAAQTFTWDSAGSTGGTYVWTVTASNSAGSDSGTITVDNFGAEWYGTVPIVDQLKFAMHSPLSNGGVVEGKITATDNPNDWSELLCPSYKSQQYGPVSAPTGIQTPNWNPADQEFSWNMQGATAGIYTWYVKASSLNGTGAGSIEVRILVPEPSAALLTIFALITANSLIRRRPT